MPLRPARPAARSNPSNNSAVELSSMPMTIGITSARLSDPPGPNRAASGTATRTMTENPSFSVRHARNHSRT